MREVVKLVDTLKPKFFLQGWHIDIGVHKEPSYDNPEAAATMKPRNCYREATLDIYPPFFQQNEEDKRDIIVHEFCHIMTGIQNGLLNTARNSTQVSNAEAAFAFEEETSWFAQIISSLL